MKNGPYVLLCGEWPMQDTSDFSPHPVASSCGAQSHRPAARAAASGVSVQPGSWNGRFLGHRRRSLPRRRAFGQACSRQGDCDGFAAARRS